MVEAARGSLAVDANRQIWVRQDISYWWCVYAALGRLTAVRSIICLAGWSKFWGDDGYIKIHRGGNE
jgi:hypothetical protein